MIEILLPVLTNDSEMWSADPIIGTSLPSGRVNASAIELHGKLYIAGGAARVSGNGQAINSILEFDPISNIYTTFGTLPQAVYYGTMTTDGTYLYHYGGQQFPSTVLSSTLVRYDPITKERIILANGPIPKWIHHMFFHNGKIYIYGGATLSKDFYTYDIADNTWSTISAPVISPEARSGSSGVYLNGKFYLIGGASNFTDTWEYDVNINVWRQLNDFPLITIYGKAFTIDDRILLTPGTPLVSGVANKNIYEYILDQDEWVLLKYVNNITIGSAIANYNKRVYFFGGSPNTTVVSAGSTMFYLK